MKHAFPRNDTGGNALRGHAWVNEHVAELVGWETYANREVFKANGTRTSQAGMRYFSRCDTTGRRGVCFAFRQQRFVLW